MLGFLNHHLITYRIRLVAVATQKFVAEVASDALQYVSKF
ncbi:hypothetical protein CK203_027404 [Vitis vinifera]|uniref:Uncharacterized protein n=1 Tax=Vitis vinifera TaxID=29760 RepID=A0A438E8Y1_VITVI|nr:hypothetical protein CK203_108477 [Vitis vinifera]RVX05703.1 hypothetical protein CK203_027404 [Vitis vinifera]